eukprot:1159232-Pelagomonas_calceolata.AAC.2
MRDRLPSMSRHCLHVSSEPVRGAATKQAGRRKACNPCLLPGPVHPHHHTAITQAGRGTMYATLLLPSPVHPHHHTAITQAGRGTICAGLDAPSLHVPWIFLSVPVPSGVGEEVAHCRAHVLEARWHCAHAQKEEARGRCMCRLRRLTKEARGRYMCPLQWLTEEARGGAVPLAVACRHKKQGKLKKNCGTWVTAEVLATARQGLRTRSQAGWHTAQVWIGLQRTYTCKNAYFRYCKSSDFLDQAIISEATMTLQSGGYTGTFSLCTARGGQLLPTMGIFKHAPGISSLKLRILKLGCKMSMYIALGSNCPRSQPIRLISRSMKPTYWPPNLHSRPPTASSWLIWSLQPKGYHCKRNGVKSGVVG